MAKQLREVERTMQEVQSILSETFNDFVIVGLRKLEDHEKQGTDETERPYWFISGNPIFGVALTGWALEVIIAKLQEGVLDRLDQNELKPEKLEEIIKEFTTAT